MPHDFDHTPFTVTICPLPQDLALYGPHGSTDRDGDGNTPREAWLIRLERELQKIAPGVWIGLGAVHIADPEDWDVIRKLREDDHWITETAGNLDNQENRTA
jgi:hypothetical protein